MNTATRVIEVPLLGSAKKSKATPITRMSMMVTALVGFLLLTAFAVVYIKDLNRRLFIQYQNLQREKVQEIIQWGKLLLEQSTWSTQSRVQQIAQRELGMFVPSEGEIVMVGDRHENATIR